MNVLVVSAFYKIDSKRSFEAYLKRIHYLLSNTTCNFLIFTSEDMVDILPKRQGIEYRILPISEFYSNQFATEEEYETIRKWYSNSVAEKPISVELIKIYAEKHMFVNRAIDLYPNYSYYIWNDIGMVIGEYVVPYLPTFPSISKIHQLNIGDKICFAVRDTVSLNEYNSGIPEARIRLDCPIAGTVILGNKVAWRRFIPLYHASLSYLKKNQGCWGNDEHVYFHMLCKNPDTITGVITYGFKLPIKDIYQCNSWNMFTYMLSDKFTDEIETFQQVRSIDGYSNINHAFWGIPSKYTDVTDILKNKKDTSRIYIDCNLFNADPTPGVSKQLYIEYNDGRTQCINEYKYCSLLL